MMGSNIASLIPYIIAGLGTLVALFFKFKADKAGAMAEIAKIVTQDAPLAAKQSQIEDQIKAVENQDDSKLTPEERANRWNK